MIQLLQADARQIPIRDESVQCVVTSPPYFHARDYGLPPSIWGGDPDHRHEWEAGGLAKTGGNHGSCEGFTRRPNRLGRTAHDECRCGAWRGCLGLEPTVDMFVAHVVEVFREVRRVLRKDGTVWLNIGDSYAASTLSNHNRGKATPALNGRGEPQAEPEGWENPARVPPSPGTKPKDLLLVPWRVALALQADGWWVRDDIVWNKPNGMPEAVEDRPARMHEYVLLLSRSAQYFYDRHAVAEPTTGTARPRGSGVHPKSTTMNTSDHGRVKANSSFSAAVRDVVPERNCRSVWTIHTQPYEGAHFAAMPEALAERCVRAGTSASGCCAECGAPRSRVIARLDIKDTGAATGNSEVRADGKTRARDPSGAGGNVLATRRVARDIWLPGCECGAPIVPCTVLDPFSGSGTVGRVAAKLGRRAVLVDLKPEYHALAKDRTTEVQVDLLAANGVDA